MTHEKAARPMLTGASTLLARHLRYGPLETLDELRTRAKELANTIETNERDYLWDLVELVRLAHRAMAEFHEFTHELATLVDGLASTRALRLASVGRSTK